MLLGTFTCRLDNKGRVLFPAGYLKQLPEGEREEFVLKHGQFASCLVMYPLRDFARMAESLRGEFPRHSEEGDRRVRNFYRTVSQVTLDKTNRLLLSRADIEFLGLENDVLFVGQNDCIEIWEPERYYESES